MDPIAKPSKKKDQADQAGADPFAPPPEATVAQDEEQPAAPLTVKLRNVHHAKATYTLRASEMGPEVDFSDDRGHEHLVTAAQAEYLLGEKYRRVHENDRIEIASRFARV